jgi:phosphoglycerate dehydrogenase-like enzyme
MDRLSGRRETAAAGPPAAAMRIALLDVARAQASRLSSLLEFPHDFVAAADAPQPVDAAIALRFGRSEARQFEPRLLHLPGAGADQVDFGALPAGCVVCNVFEHEIPLAEYVLAAILEHAIGYAALRAAFDADRWPETYARRHTHAEIHGKTLGLVGYGHVGRAVTERARAFGMRVHAVSASGRAPGADWSSPVANLRELLPVADYLVIACPLTPETRGLVGAAELSLMKRSAVLINIARAQIVDEEPLYVALAEGRLGGATLDVWYQYPNADTPAARPSRFPFHRLPNVHCTAHSSAWTEELFARRYAVIAENLNRLRQGRPLRNVIHSADASHQIHVDAGATST